MGIHTSAGSKIYIGTTAAIDFTSDATATTAFKADSYTQVGLTESIGNFGDTASDITFTGLGDQRTQHLKGSFDGGKLTVTAGYDTSDDGQIALKAALKSPNDFNFRIVDNDAPDADSATVTITIATPGVVTWTGHGLSAGDAVSFSTDGALPTGITANTTYYVLATGLTSNAFEIAATPGGTAIDTTGTQSGDHTGATLPVGTTTYFRGKVQSFQKQYGTGPNNVVMLSCDIGINSAQIEIPASQ